MQAGVIAGAWQLTSMEESTCRIAGNFCRCKILLKCCIHFRINFRSFVFALAGCGNWPHLCMLHLSAEPGKAFLHQEHWPSYPCRLGNLSCLPQQKTMKPISNACFCTYTRRIDCLSCSGASRRQAPSSFVLQSSITVEAHFQIQKFIH